jgi:peptide/nickel transport system substrate-binding protein
MYSKTTLYSILLVFLGSLFSCNPASNKVQLQEDAKLSDGEKYIHNPNSKEILADWSKENTVVFHCTSLPDDLHPTNGNSSGRAFINNYTQHKLLASDIQNLSIRPDLVKSLPTISPDELSFTYELKIGPKWDNGQSVSVEDVLFTFKANACLYTNNPAAKSYLSNVEDFLLDAANPYKFTIKMKERYVQNLIFLTEIPILQKSFFDSKNVLSNYSFKELAELAYPAKTEKELKLWATEFNDSKYGHLPQHLVGLGAYQIESWESGQSITLVKKKAHWSAEMASKTAAETAYPDKIIFKLNQDENSQILDFKNQNLDASTWLATKTLLLLQQDSNFNRNYFSRFTDSFDYTYMGFNTKPDGIKHKKYFTDKKVRRALAYLTPVDQFIELVFKGKAKRMASNVVPAKVGDYNTDLKLIPFDVAAAKKLLDEAGWKDTDGDKIRDKVIAGEKVQLSFDLNYMAGPSFIKDVVLMITEAMYQAGVKANPQALDFALFYEKAQTHDFDAMLGAWSGSCFPDDFTQTWHSKSWSTQGSNYTGFGDAQSDALIDSIKVCLNDSIRTPLVKRLQTLIYEEQPYVFLYSAQRKNVIHKRFGNADMFFERPGVLLNNLKLLHAAKETAN